MEQQRPLSIVHDAGAEARDHYRWLLLAGWFVLISTVLSFVIATPHHAQPVDGILIALAALAFVAYSIAIKRYWAVGLGISIAFIVMGWIIASR
ncbi:MAG TPA: hypothetical protein VER58_03605 [Thermoanaerobaculia bacterium]|nr:hypothetical protein [Thermoanaerobaculia bacterium]